MELCGFRDVNSFYNPIPPNFHAPAQSPVPDATQVLAQVQMAELNLKANTEAETLKLKRYEIDLKNATDRFKATLAAQAQVQTGEARSGMQFQQVQLQASADQAGQEADAQTQKELAAITAQAQIQQTAMQHGADAMSQASQQQHEATMQQNAPTPSPA